MTNPMLNPDPVPQRFGEAPPESLYEQHMASHLGGDHEHEHAPEASTDATAPAESSQSAARCDDAVPKAEGCGCATNANGVTEDDVREALRDVIDPELGINVVDLGLLYGVRFEDDDTVTLEMTLTSAACPLTDVIEDQARTVLASLVSKVNIQWVWIPPWGPDCITDEGREQLRALGFNV